MLTKDDLKAIVEVIQPLIRSEVMAEGEATRKAIKKDIALNNKVFSTILKVELGETRQKIAADMSELIKHIKVKNVEQDDRLTALETSKN